MFIKFFNLKPQLIQNNLQIIACAGSGKTEFVSSRIAHLIYKNLAKSENIVAFTFTDKAAEELKFRIRSKIRELLGHQPDIGDMYVGTIHSFCFELLKEYVPDYRAYDVLDEGKRFSFINSIHNDIGFKDLKEWLESTGEKKPYGITVTTWIINTFIRNIDIVREEMKKCYDVCACNSFTRAFKIYEDKLQEKRFLDFSSMMSLAVKTLQENNNILTEVRKKYTHITVDEYQDINPIQEKLIELLTGPTNNLCVVGDDDQSIYQWRGAQVENILTFKKRYKDVYTYSLPVNYRSTDKIVELSNNFIRSNKRRLPKSMKSSEKRAHKGDIYKIEFYNKPDEINFVVNKIQELIGTEWIEKDKPPRGLAYSDVAIFFRSVKYDAQDYLKSLDEAKIPYAVSGIGGLFNANEVDIIFSILSYLGDFEKIWEGYSKTRVIPDEYLIYSLAKDLFILPHKNIFIQRLKELKENVKQRKRVSLQSLYAEILTLLGISNEQFHNESNGEIRMYNLGRLSQAISDYEGTKTYCTYKDIHQFCWFIKHYAEGNYDAGAGEDPTRIINAVQVMTLHVTKGLGFPVIFMPYCVERIEHPQVYGFLGRDKIDLSRYAGSQEDERRLFYVGMTRAKKFLYITTSIDPGPKRHKKIPSKFFKEIDDSYCITDTKPDPTRKNKLKPQPSIEDYRFPTNYSELSDYIRCEYDYKMRYIYGFNPELVQALGFGKQVHNILNILHKQSQENKKVPSPEDTVKILLEQFYLRYAAKEQEETLKKSALKSILRYIDMWKEDFSLSVKSERPFEMDLENALISGTIDLLKRAYVNEDILEIIDFKTGNERRMDDELSLQVQLYTIAAREALKLNVKKAYVHFLDDTKQQRVEIPITPNQLNLALKTIKDTVKGIISRRFNRNPINKKICNKCDWRRICPQ